MIEKFLKSIACLEFIISVNYHQVEYVNDDIDTITLIINFSRA